MKGKEMKIVIKSFKISLLAALYNLVLLYFLGFFQGLFNTSETEYILVLISILFVETYRKETK